MTMRTIRVRVHQGCFEPIDKLDLPEGSEVSVNYEEPGRPETVRPKAPLLRPRHLGVKGPITREEIYEDVG